MKNTITKISETEQDIAPINGPQNLCSDPNTGIWPVLKIIAEGRAILPSRPHIGLPPSDAAFTSDITVEEALRKVRGP